MAAVATSELEADLGGLNLNLRATSARMRMRK
jgi:hypothetical protein